MRFQIAFTILMIAATTLAQIPSFLTTDFPANQGNQELEVVLSPNNKLVEGKQLFLKDVANLPSFKLCDSCGISPDTNYMIMLLDVSARGEGKGETPQNLHYLQTDFGTGLGGTDLSSPEKPLMPYLPPSPQPGTGKHRYVWLLFLQRAGITASGIKGIPSENNRSFDVLAWIKENNLSLPEWGISFVVEAEGQTGKPTATSSTTTVASSSTTTAVSSSTTTVVIRSSTSLTSKVLTSTKATSSSSALPATTTTMTRMGTTRSTGGPEETVSSTTSRGTNVTVSIGAPTIPVGTTFVTSSILVTPVGPTRTPTPSGVGDSQGDAPRLFKGAWAAGVVALASVVLLL